MVKKRWHRPITEGNMTDNNTRLALLDTYGISPVTGFVPPVDPPRALPPALRDWDEMVTRLPALLQNGGVRAALADLPLHKTDALLSEPDKERALLVLSVLATAWVWGEDAPVSSIPIQIAQPLCTLAKAMRRPPVVHYASMTLQNWTPIDNSKPVSADNARTVVSFLNTVDEDWFFVASLGVELEGVGLINAIHDVVSRSHHGTDQELTVALYDARQGIDAVNVALERVRERCRPHVFYARVRPFLRGWSAPGVVYEGVADEPKEFVGGSAGQSSLLQSIDAVLGVVHDSPQTGAYLTMLRTYMPPGHRRFVEDVEGRTNVRYRLAAGEPALRSAYNDVLAGVVEFRQRHRAMARDFILSPSGMNANELGTGGTELETFLQTATLETAARAV